MPYNKRRNPFEVNTNNYGLGLNFSSNPFESIVWTPTTQWTPTEQNWDKLKDASIKQETRQNSAETSSDTLETEFGGYRDKLNMQDEETANWWNNLENTIKADVKSYADKGDWAGAKRVADRWAAELKNNQELKDRMQYNADYNAWVEDLKKRRDEDELSVDAYNWAITNNPYKFNRKVSDNGQYSTYDKWDNKKIFKKIDWDGIVKAAAADVPDSSSRGETRRADGSYSSYDIHKKTVEDIFEQAYNKFTTDQDFYNSVKQEVDIAEDALLKKINEYEKDKDSFNKELFIDQLASYYIDPRTNHTYYTLKGKEALSPEEKATLSKLEEQREQIYKDKLELFTNGQKPSHDENYYKNYIRNKIWRSSKNRAYRNSQWDKGEATSKSPSGGGDEDKSNLTTTHPTNPGNSVNSEQKQYTSQGFAITPGDRGFTNSGANNVANHMSGNTSEATVTGN